MKIGIYIKDYAIGEGGANSLLNTFQRGIGKLKKEDLKITVIYDGKASRPYKEEKEGIEFINLFLVRMHYMFLSKMIDMKNFPKRVAYWLADRKASGSTSSIWDIMCRKEGIDILWFTSSVQERTSVPYIFTVWDLGHRLLPSFPEMKERWQDRENMYQQMLYKATFVTTANETGKKEILENYSIPSEKIRILPFPVADFCMEEEKKPEAPIPDAYFFYPAQFWAHKNHIRVIEAVKILKEKYSTKVNMVFTGTNKGNMDHIKKEIEKNGLKEQFYFLDHVSYPEIKYLYKNAIALVYASLLGPNNMPPDEAIYLRCPVIITGIEGHREQLGNAAMYFDGYDAGNLAKCMYDVMDDPEVRDELIKCSEDHREKLRSYQYNDEISKIIAELVERRKCWG